MSPAWWWHVPSAMGVSSVQEVKNLPAPHLRRMKEIEESYADMCTHSP
jgi:hypothetical protein